MKTFLITAAMGVTLTSFSAFANSTVCSNADQSFAYSYETSNGGAPLDHKHVRYQGQSAESFNPQTDPPIIVNLTNLKTLQKKELPGGGSETTYSGVASGSFQVEGQQVEFSGELVICKNDQYPMCRTCP